MSISISTQLVYFGIFCRNFSSLCILLSNRAARGSGPDVKLMSTLAKVAGFVELRQYIMKPEGIKDFLKLTETHVDLRKTLLPFLGCDKFLLLQDWPVGAWFAFWSAEYE